MKKKVLFPLLKSSNLFSLKIRKKHKPDFSYRKELYSCQQCGLCQTICPLVKVSGLETFGPRAKISMLRAFLEGRLASEEITPLFSACLFCGACAKICPLSLPLQDIFAKARALVHLHKRTWRDRIGYIIQRNPTLSGYLQPAIALLLRNLKKRRIENGLPLFPYRPFKISTARNHIAAADIDKQILLYPGCIARHISPEISESAAGLASQLGYKILSPSLPCCGRANRLQGNNEEVLALVRKNLKLLNGCRFSHILTLCPGCMLEISRYWPEVEGLTQEEKIQAEELAHKCVSLEEFIENSREKLLFSRSTERVYIHISCLTPDSRSKRIKLFFTADSSYVIDESGICCGAFSAFPSGASNCAKEYGKTVAKNLHTHILSHHPSQIFTTCPACKLQLERILSQNGETIPVRHVAELYFSLFTKERNTNPS